MSQRLFPPKKLAFWVLIPGVLSEIINTIQSVSSHLPLILFREKKNQTEFLIGKTSRPYWHRWVTSSEHWEGKSREFRKNGHFAFFLHVSHAAKQTETQRFAQQWFFGGGKKSQRWFFSVGQKSEGKKQKWRLNCHIPSITNILDTISWEWGRKIIAVDSVPRSESHTAILLSQRDRYPPRLRCWRQRWRLYLPAANWANIKGARVLLKGGGRGVQGLKGRLTYHESQLPGGREWKIPFASQ